MKKLLSIAVLAAAFITCQAVQADVVTQWNFNGSSTTPTTGSGSISLIGGATSTGFNSGAGSSDPTQPGLGYQTTTYPTQSTASGTAGVQFNVSTAGFTSAAYSSIDLIFDLRTSNTSSAWYRVDWSADSGASWNLGAATRVTNVANAGDQFHNSKSLSISDAGVFDNANAAFRVVSVFSPVEFTELNTSTLFAADTAYEAARNRPLAEGANSAYAGGTWRFDMVTVNATAVPEPASMALLGVAGVAGVVVRRYRKNRSTEIAV